MPYYQLALLCAERDPHGMLSLSQTTFVYTLGGVMDMTEASRLRRRLESRQTVSDTENYIKPGEETLADFYPLKR